MWSPAQDTPGKRVQGQHLGTAWANSALDAPSRLRIKCGLCPHFYVNLTIHVCPVEVHDCAASIWTGRHRCEDLLVHRLAYNGDVASGQLAVFQGASEAPISGFIR